MQGVLGTATGIGAATSHAVTGFVVQAAGYDAGFLTLAAIAALALCFYACAMPETIGTALLADSPTEEPAPEEAMLSIDVT
jgi:sugar phosphate permease